MGKSKKLKKQQSSQITVFYSWQSDLQPQKYTRNAISDALKRACKRIEADPSGVAGGKNLLVDHATRDVPGSPNIPDKIIEKILASDIFVADVSIVTPRPGNTQEGMPNSNVVFELGFAAATLGWERILLVVNEAHGSVKNLPFDFDRNRATPYNYSSTEGSKAPLTDTLQQALSLIIKKDPSRVAVNTVDIAEIEHQRDLTNLKWLLGSLHWPSIKHHIDLGPSHISRVAEDFFEETREILSSPLFHLYDPTLKADVKKFYGHWANSMRFDHYTPTANQRLYRFTSSGIASLEREQKHWDYMQQERVHMFAAMQKLLEDLRGKFPEIDIHGESRSAGRRYDAQIAEIEKSFKPLKIKSSSSKQHQKRKRKGNRG